MQYESNPADGFRDIVRKRNTDARPDMVITISPAPTSWAGEQQSVTHLIMQAAKTEQSRNAVLLSGQLRRHWDNIETVSGDSQCLLGRAAAKYTDGPVLEWCWASVIDNLSALNQQWAVTLAQHWTGIRWVGLHRVYQRHVAARFTGKYWIDVGQHPRCWCEGINDEDIF